MLRAQLRQAQRRAALEGEAEAGGAVGQRIEQRDPLPDAQLQHQMAGVAGLVDAVAKTQVAGRDAGAESDDVGATVVGDLDLARLSVDQIPVVAGAAREQVAAAAAGQRVVAVVTPQRVVAGTPVEAIVARAAGEHVGGIAACEPVVVVLAPQLVAAVAAFYRIPAGATDELIVAVATGQRVVPRGA